MDDNNIKKEDEIIKEFVSVRIDRYLQHTLLYPSRKDAKQALLDEEVFINDKIAKPSSKIKDGDQLYIDYGDLILVVKANIYKQDNKIYVGYDIISKNKRSYIEC